MPLLPPRPYMSRQHHKWNRTNPVLVAMIGGPPPLLIPRLMADSGNFTQQNPGIKCCLHRKSWRARIVRLMQSLQVVLLPKFSFTSCLRQIREKWCGVTTLRVSVESVIGAPQQRQVQFYTNTHPSIQDSLTLPSRPLPRPTGSHAGNLITVNKHGHDNCGHYHGWRSGFPGRRLTNDYQFALAGRPTLVRHELFVGVYSVRILFAFCYAIRLILLYISQHILLHAFKYHYAVE